MLLVLGENGFGVQTTRILIFFAVYMLIFFAVIYIIFAFYLLVRKDRNHILVSEGNPVKFEEIIDASSGVHL